MDGGVVIGMTRRFLLDHRPISILVFVFARTSIDCCHAVAFSCTPRLRIKPREAERVALPVHALVDVLYHRVAGGMGSGDDGDG